MRPHNPNPVVIYLKSPQDRYHAEQERLAAEEYRPPEIHHYDALRPTLTHIAFAEHILKDHGLLYTHHGHVFLNGQYATPAAKIDAANAILKRMKLAPIVLGKRS